MAAGPPLGGILFKILGYPGPFFILGGVSLVYAFCVLSLFIPGFESVLKSGEISHEES